MVGYTMQRPGGRRVWALGELGAVEQGAVDAAPVGLSCISKSGIFVVSVSSLITAITDESSTPALSVMVADISTMPPTISPGEGWVLVMVGPSLSMVKITCTSVRRPLTFVATTVSS